jgi:hypothetical protein
VYAKAAGRDWFRISIIDKAGSFPGVYFNLSDGTKGSEIVSPLDVSITPVGNGWYRCSVTASVKTGGSTPGARVFLASNNGVLSYQGDGTSGIYLWGAQLEQSPAATAYVKSNVTWQSRASRATYYDENGVVRTVPANLLLRSEEFNDAVWGDIGGGTVTRNANATAAPNGALTADELVFPSADVGVAQNLTVLSGVTYTVSIWIKGTAGQTIRFTANSIPVPLGTPSNVTLTGEWTRYSFTNVSTGTSASLNLSTFGGATARSIYVWGAQLEESSTVSEYIPTTTAIASLPRNNAYLPDGNGNFVSAGDVLLEKASTNLLLRSEEFDAAAWASTNSSATPAAGIAPNGANNAWEFKDSSDVSAAVHSLQQSVSFTSGIAYTLSIYAKAASIEGIHLLLPSVAFGVDTRANYDLVNGTASVQAGTVTVSIQDAGNGWYRCIATSTASSTASAAIQLRTMKVVAGTLSSFYQGDGNGSILVWGAQLEQSTYPTSYIQTTGTERTRAADVSTSSSGFGNSWYSQSEGTMFAETVTQGFTVTSFPRIASFDRGNGSVNFIALVRSSGSRRQQYSVFATTGQAVGLEPNVTLTEGLPARSGFVYKADDFIAAVQGVLSAADTLGSLPTSITTFGIGAQGDGSLPYNGALRRLVYWRQRLPNSVLQSITQ